MTERSANDHAIIVGGSMAGMVAARVLADHFASVTVLDRDDEPEAPAHRNGVPHGRHLHLLLLGGQQVLEALFPGFARDLLAVGSVVLRAGYDTLAYDGDVAWPLRDLGFRNYSQTRPLLEHVVRQQRTLGCTLFGLAREQGAAAEQLDGAVRTPARPRGARPRAATRRRRHRRPRGGCCARPRPREARATHPATTTARATAAAAHTAGIPTRSIRAIDSA